MKYIVKQIVLNREEARNKPEKLAAWLGVSAFPEGPHVVQAAYRFYDTVAEIEAEGLEDVFRVGNIGPEEQITRLGRMHSLSVGDIVVEPDGVEWYVDVTGFTVLNES